MSHISDLRDLLDGKAAELTEDMDRLECLAVIDDWYSVRTALASLDSGSEVQSYTMGGRTVSMREPAAVRTQERALWARIQELLYLRGSVGLDLRAQFLEV